MLLGIARMSNILSQWKDRGRAAHRSVGDRDRSQAEQGKDPRCPLGGSGDSAHLQGPRLHQNMEHFFFLPLFKSCLPCCSQEVPQSQLWAEIRRLSTWRACLSPSFPTAGCLGKATCGSGKSVGTVHCMLTFVYLFDSLCSVTS